MAEVQLESVRKSYGGTEILHDIDLSIRHGEFVVFVGPSGSGKSTLLRMIGGLEQITGGRLSIDNQVVNHLDAADRNLGMVFQSYALYPHLSVRDNLAFPLRMAKVPRDAIGPRVEEVAGMLQIAHLLDRRPKQLSGGQRQRVAIGRAIVREPKVFLFDEPLSNLDTELRVQMRVQIAKLHRELGNTMIYVTHDQVEAMTMADKIVVLRNGHIEQVGTPHELYHQPSSQFVAGFIGSPRMNFLKAACVNTGPGGVTVSLSSAAPVVLPVEANGVSPGQAVTVGVRPDDFTAPTSDHDQLRVELDVDFVEHLGNATYLYGTVGGEALVARAPAEGNFAAPMGRVSLSVARGDCHLFDASGQALRRRNVPRAWN
ncbi:sn-glycerol-3-phosphate ABC transporter ATP-binding protein UgpC [Paraburkholderia caribensis]|uniref:ABC transporter related n=2 Tax=Paraburkholderia TaxID=1822464 RepID=B2JXP7_PARP8|nr:MULTISPECIES: sn-glycerol-3-phosphate ABC transporter ATP-binding protein UgpC [Paraburkholderia]ACC76405.1 ABC transporter related [Paraburkholderia phymatum STM815]MCO4882867.1 sn-glycerol-3-phosphate ABC transporter ATP-binding protein UgpC [Paraburkholderia caribensis]PTB23675.1 sn-glycerol-3-phosphate ABC transporter ATP-binding protein UgpC [Paraburkholderia caribensis]